MKALFEGVAHHRVQDEWETPPSVFDPLDEEFHFTLDPCAIDDTAKCEVYFTPDDDGLTQPWAPHRVFMNPPYHRDELPKWVAKAYRESLKGALVVCLLPASTSTRWWHRYCMKGEIRFVRGRIRFIGAPYNAPFPNVIVIFRPPHTGGKKIMVKRVKGNVYTEANVKHIVCPKCKGTGTVLVIDLSTKPPPGRILVNGRYAEVCDKCHGDGWIHKKLGPDKEVSGD